MNSDNLSTKVEDGADNAKLFEQSEFANETGAAIHLAPNCNGILRRFGLFAEKIGANDMLGVGRELLRQTKVSPSIREHNAD
jgi:hypothetical protein